MRGMAGVVRKWDGKEIVYVQWRRMWFEKVISVWGS